MNFRKCSKEDRAEWHGHPMTRAALELVRELLEMAQAEVQSAAVSGGEREVRVAAGKVRAFDQALSLLSEE